MWLKASAHSMRFDNLGRKSYCLSMKTIVSEKGQITIPKALRNKLGLGSGTVLRLAVAGDKLVGRKEVEQDPAQKWRGRGQLPEGMTVDEYISRVRGDHGR